MNMNYREALCEVSYIINGLDKEDYNKIPEKFVGFIEENKSKYYEIKFALDMPYESLNLKNETLAILAVIYRKYLAPEDKREELNKRYYEKLKDEKSKLKNIQNEKIKVNNMFNNAVNNEIVRTTETDISKEIIAFEEKWYKKIFNKLKSIFSKGGAY